MDFNDIELMMLLEGMVVEKNGKVYKVKKYFFNWLKFIFDKKMILRKSMLMS